MSELILAAVDPPLVVVRLPATSTVLATSPAQRVIEAATETRVLVVETTERVVVTASGPQGPPGAGSVTTVIAAAIIQAFSVVAVDVGGAGYPPDKDVPADAYRVLGIAKSAALPGEPVEVATAGLLPTGAITWPLGPLYLGDGGALTSTPPAAAFHLEVAVAVTTSELIVRPQLPITLA